MKISLFILAYLLTMGLALAQFGGNEEDMDNATAEESFYEGSQVNPDVFLDDFSKSDAELEESIPDVSDEEIYPYENVGSENEVEYNPEE